MAKGDLGHETNSPDRPSLGGRPAGARPQNLEGTEAMSSIISPRVQRNPEADRDLLPLSGAEQRASLEALLQGSAADRHPIAWWHGVLLVIDERRSDTLLAAALDDVDDFVDQHGEPATHARARAVAEAAIDRWDAEISRAMDDGYDEWCDMMRRDRDPEGI